MGVPYNRPDTVEPVEMEEPLNAEQAVEPESDIHF